MRKEVPIAVVAGVIIGIIIGLGVWRANSALKTKVEISPTSEAKREPSPTGISQEFKVVLARPEEDDVLTASPTTLSGITKANSLIVTSGPKEDFVIQTDSSGSFEQAVELEAGLNQVLVAAFDTTSQKREVLRTVVFSEEFAKQITKTEPEQISATGEDTGVREKVREKIESVRKNPKAYIGTVTDKSQDSLQIKNSQGEIQLISIDPQASFVKVTKITSKISFDDIAIGDFIVAMGVSDGNEVLSATRVLITEGLKPFNRTIVLGQIIKVEKKKLILQEGERQLVLEFPKSWKGPEIKELKEGDKLIAVGEFQDNVLTVRTIQIVTKN